MAYLGLRKIKIAKLNGSTYDKPVSLGKAIGLNVNPSYAEGSVYGDDELAEYDKEFRYADVTLDTSTIPIEADEQMFGHTVNKEKNEIVYGSEDEAAYVGVAWLTAEKVDGVKKYCANFLPKVKFSEPSDEFATKGENIEYKTPSISGRAMANEKKWKRVKKFNTEAEAQAAADAEAARQAAEAQAAADAEAAKQAAEAQAAADAEAAR